MLFRNGLFSSESVSEGHPDKLADQISDAVLDAFLAEDPHARVACETMLADDLVVVAGEFKAKSQDIFESIRDSVSSIVRDVLRGAGYDDAATGIDPDACEIRVKFNSQSDNINQGVDRADGIIGAGDQGLMFGYACDETPQLMPLAITLAHRLVRRQAELRKNGTLPWLRPDAKSQVSIDYRGGKAISIDTVVLSTQHAQDIDQDSLRAAVTREIIEPTLAVAGITRSSAFRLFINPTGRFVTGGPKGDCGLTGRKIVVDTYGGAAPHGGGAFSGKDPSKVDRSAAYIARFLAKQVVSRGWASKCLIQLAYAIGVAKPVSVAVETFGTHTLDENIIVNRLLNEFDLTPAGIIKKLDLLRPIYRQTASYGHFGREDVIFPWERTDFTGEPHGANTRGN